MNASSTLYILNAVVSALNSNYVQVFTQVLAAITSLAVLWFVLKAAIYIKYDKDEW